VATPAGSKPVMGSKGGSKPGSVRAAKKRKPVKESVQKKKGRGKKGKKGTKGGKKAKSSKAATGN
jgi:hypothetical protein